MKAFRFTLEAVHTLRQRQAQKAMEQYVQALLGRQQALDHLEFIREKIAANQQEISRLLSAGCTAAPAAQAHQFSRILEKQQAERVTALALAERRVNAAFQAMVAARQQRRMVENFRDKQQARHEHGLIREEQKMLDDLASRRARPMFSWNPREAAI